MKLLKALLLLILLVITIHCAMASELHVFTPNPTNGIDNPIRATIPPLVPSYLNYTNYESSTAATLGSDTSSGDLIGRLLLLFNFSESGLPSTARIDNVSLQLNLSDRYVNGGVNNSIDIYEVLTGWSEDNSSWQWNTTILGNRTWLGLQNATDYKSTIIGNLSNASQIPVGGTGNSILVNISINTTVFQEWLNGTRPNKGMFFINHLGEDGNAENSIKIKLSDNTVVGARPTFFIYYNVTPTYLKQCEPTINQTTLKMVVKNEDYPTLPLNATLKIEGKYWTTNASTATDFNISLSGNDTYALCIYPADTTFYADAYLKYIVSEGFTHRYYLINETLTNNTQTITLYNFNTTTSISDLKVTIRNKDTYNYFENVTVKLLRHYPGEGLWRTVQMDRSGDYGLTFFNIKEQTTDYKLVFVDNDNHVLKTGESMKLVCTSAVCDLTYLISSYGTATVSDEFSASWSFDNATNIINVSWGDPSGATQSMRLQVTKDQSSGTIYICNSTQTGTSGILTCDVTGYEGTVRITLFNTASPEKSALTAFLTLPKVVLAGGIVLREEAGFWAFGILLTMIGFGVVAGATGVVISTLMGLFVLNLLGLLTVITTPLLIIVGVMGIVIMLKVRQ